MFCCNQPSLTAKATVTYIKVSQSLIYPLSAKKRKNMDSVERNKNQNEIEAVGYENMPFFGCWWKKTRGKNTRIQKAKENKKIKMPAGATRERIV